MLQNQMLKIVHDQQQMFLAQIVDDLQAGSPAP